MIGLFVHFGLYSVVAYRHITDRQRKKFREEGGGNGAEWLLDLLKCREGDWRPPAGWRETQQYVAEHFGGDYESLVERLAGVDWSPEPILRMAAQIGASYVVFTTKHHDGFAMYPSDVAPKWCSARDYVGELARACREKGLRFGAYYSWPEFGKSCTIPFMRDKIAQVREIQERYRPDIWWFDGHWAVTTKAAQGMVKAVVGDLKEANPAVEINDRLGAEYKTRKDDLDWKGDATFRNFEDRYLPARTPTVPWEYIDTVGFSWGRNTAQVEEDYKTGAALMELYRQVRARGGRFMINVGPNADGSLDPWEERSLGEFGALKA